MQLGDAPAVWMHQALLDDAPVSEPSRMTTLLTEEEEKDEEGEEKDEEGMSKMMMLMYAAIESHLADVLLFFIFCFLGVAHDL